MKKLTTVSLFIFWAALTAILTAGLVFYQNNKTQGNNSTQNASSQQSASSVPAGVTLNLTEIAKHNSVNDCWLLINGKVYNVTSYLGAHPGGVATIAAYCGKEATQAFDTKGGIGQAHSGSANALLANYYIGDLNQMTTQQQVQQNVQNTNAVTPPAGGGGREDD